MKIRKLYTDKELIEEYKNIKFKNYNGRPLYEARNTVSTVRDNVLKQYETKGRFDVRGHRVDTPEDLAILCKLFRDSRFETNRVLYVKNGEVVGADFNTWKDVSHAPILFDFNTSDSKPTSEPDTIRKKYVKTLDYINRKAYKLKCDGVYFLHNHPSGDVRPSEDDIKTDNLFKRNIWKYKDSLIVGDNLVYSIGNECEIPFDNDNDDKRLKDDSMKLHSSTAVVQYSKNLLDNKNYSLLIYLSASCDILKIDTIKNTEFKDEKIFKYLMNQKKEIGAHHLFIYTEQKNIFDVLNFIILSEAIRMNMITDFFIYDDENNTVKSVRSWGYSPSPEYNNLGKRYDKLRGLKG